MNQKLAIVTGGAGGIGKAVASSLSQEGFYVIIVDRDREIGSRIASEIGCHFEAVDLRKPDQCRSVVRKIGEEMGRIDVLVNNAGLQHVCGLPDFPEEKWNELIQVMLTAPFLLTKHSWPYLERSKSARIINMGSIHSRVASLNKAAYVSAKHGLVGLTKSTALEGGPCGITCNAICPAYVETPLARNQIDAQSKTLGIPADRVIDEVVLSQAVVKKLIQPEEIAKLVVYLCSDAASSITGSCIDIDLGWTAR